MKFTVFTPTYERAHTLVRVYDSLRAQTYNDFEWVIVDDGSTDSTADLVAGWQAENFFSIHYEKQGNHGKHIAVNRGAQMARGELFLIADSDDAFPPDALQIFHDVWMHIPEPQRADFTGVTGLCIDRTGVVVGDKFPTDVFDSTPADCFYCHGIRGEKWGFHRTDVIRQFPFPALKGFRFFAEGIIWNAIGRVYKTRYINRTVRIYHDDSGNQLTKRSPVETSPMRIFYAMSLDADIDYLPVAPWAMFKIAAQGVRFSWHQRDSLITQFSRLSKWRAKMVWLAAVPLGVLLFLIDRRQA
jgi:glycosyltransferase involved in cell wall biosynthesis